MAPSIVLPDARYDCVRIHLDTMDTEVAKSGWSKERADHYARRINAMYKRNHLEWRVVVRPVMPS